MDTERITELLDQYSAAFGEEAAESLAVPNYLADPRFGPALEKALQDKTPISADAAEALFGQPFREAVL